MPEWLTFALAADIATIAATIFVGYALLQTRAALHLTREANGATLKAEDARLVFQFPDGLMDMQGDVLLDMTITNLGRSAALIHSIEICGEQIIMEAFVQAGETRSLPRSAIVPATAGRDLKLMVDRTYPLSGRKVDAFNFRVLPPRGDRTTWWALNVDHLGGPLSAS